MAILFDGDFESRHRECNLSALRRKGWKDIADFSHEKLVDATYIVCQYDECTNDPQVLVGLAEYNPASKKLEQVGFTTGFRLCRIDYFMVVTPTPRNYSEIFFENTFLKTMEISGLMVGR